jgi:hypothetical protein
MVRSALGQDQQLQVLGLLLLLLLLLLCCYQLVA